MRVRLLGVYKWSIMISTFEFEQNSSSLHDSHPADGSTGLGFVKCTIFEFYCGNGNYMYSKIMIGSVLTGSQNSARIAHAQYFIKGDSTELVAINETEI
jgi:hypothetical protein